MGPYLRVDIAIICRS